MIVQAENISMKFNLASSKTDNFKEYIIKKIKGKLDYTEFYALKNVSFSINKGEALGILGANGSGKSTLLKCISGIYQPTQGKITLGGTIAPLIELGAGFDPDLSAKENVFLNGAVMGYTKNFMNEKYNEIVEFSELQQFMDVPIKNFSSGMGARLGFSVATLVKPDILIVDEILGVGDAAFQEKCEKKMDELKNNGTTMLFVSHSIGQVKDLCTKAIWLKKGEKIADGDAKNVCDEYEEWSKHHTAFE